MNEMEIFFNSINLIANIIVIIMSFVAYKFIKRQDKRDESRYLMRTMRDTQLMVMKYVHETELEIMEMQAEKLEAEKLEAEKRKITKYLGI